MGSLEEGFKAQMNQNGSPQAKASPKGLSPDNISPDGISPDSISCNNISSERTSDGTVSDGAIARPKLKVLMIAYFFPPLGGSGVQRTLKFVKYLPKFSILPVVSTVKSGHNFAYDKSLLQEIPESVKVYRSSSLETLWLRSVIEKFSGKKTGKKAENPSSPRQRTAEPSAASSTSSVPSGDNAHRAVSPQPDSRLQAGAASAIVNPQPDSRPKTGAASTGMSAEHYRTENPQTGSPPTVQRVSPSRKSFKRRAFDFIDDYLFVPDSKVRWLLFGFISSLKAARREEAAVLFSSSYPYTVHLIALLVQKFYRKPWIADFRDPWVGNKAMEKDIPYRKKTDAWLERKVVRQASYVINVTPTLTEMYKRRYPEHARKFVTITNGFDPADFSQVTPSSFPKFTLIHTGILSKDRSPAALVRGLELLVEERPELREKLHVLFVGFIPEEFVQMFKQSPIAELFEVRAYVPHSVCLNYLAGAHLQLLIFDDSPETKAAYSGKVFDYIGIQKPILGILPEGVAADLIRKKGIGSVVRIGDAPGIKEAVAKHYDEWLAGGGSLDSIARCAEFSRVNLAGELAELIQDAMLNSRSQESEFRSQNKGTAE